MLEAQYRLLTEGLKVNHVRLVMGTSMGGMHTWLWGQKYPGFMNALLPLASLPTQLSGRNRMWRKMVSEAIRNDPEWNNGNYQTQPRSVRLAAQMLFLMSSNPVIRQKQGPTLKAADDFFEKSVAKLVATIDANDLLCAIESSHDYDPGPSLEKIQAAVARHQFCRRPDQSSRVGHTGEGNQARETGPGNCHSAKRCDGWPWYPLQGGYLETLPRTVLEGDWH